MPKAAPLKKPKASPKPVVPEEKPSSTPSEEMKKKKTSFEKRVGITTDSLKKLLTADPPNDNIKKLKDLIRSRIHEGRRQSLKDYRVYAAIDEAYNAPFNQISPTLIGKIMNGAKRLTADEILDELKKWGLSEDTLFRECKDASGKVMKVLNRETFWKVLIPLVKSYLTIRVAKLYNDRDQYPFFAYEPTRLTEEYAAIGEILTELIEKMTSQMGYRATLRQALLQALKYSICLMFPAEVWYADLQATEKGDEFCQKEGLRYNMPHPTRMAWDQNYRPSTFNTDTGCEWALYWRLTRYGDVKNNGLYYNVEKITYGTNWFDPQFSGCYFTELYPCVAKIPFPPQEWTNNREKEASLYNTGSQDDHDKAVFLSDVFCKLNPKQWGLGDYDYKIWFRFAVASDDTIVWAEALPYSPVLYLGYDADESLAKNPSMALEIIPWQDLTGNILSQHLLTVKQNLVKIIPYDTDQIDASKILELEAKGQEAVSITWFPFSSRAARVANVDPSNMFKPVMFPQQQTTELVNTLNTVFNIMERLLVMSSSETGAVAGHIQTAEEIRVVTTNTSTRVEYTGTFVDDFIDAWKKQLFDASRSFMDEEFVVQVSKISDEAKKKLEKLGFKLGEPFQGKVEVSGENSKIAVESFISTREGKSRLNQPQIAQVLLQTIQAIAGNEMLAVAVGPEQLISFLNRAAQLAGAPQDFKVRVVPEQMALAQIKQINDQIQQISEQITTSAAQQATKQATEEVSAQVAPVIKQLAEQTAEQIKGVSDGVTQVGQVATQAAQGAQSSVQVNAVQQQQIDKLAQLVIQLDTLLKTAMQAPPPQPEPPMPGMSL